MTTKGALKRSELADHSARALLLATVRNAIDWIGRVEAAGFDPIETARRELPEPDFLLVRLMVTCVRDERLDEAATWSIIEQALRPDFNVIARRIAAQVRAWQEPPEPAETPRFWDVDRLFESEASPPPAPQGASPPPDSGAIGPANRPTAPPRLPA